MRILRPRFIFLIIVILFPFVASIAQTCQYLAYDGFNYTSNSPLNGGAGGTGWASPWEVQNNNTTIPGYQSTGNSSLSYSDLQTFGNHISGGSNYLAIGRSLNLSRSGPFASYLNNTGRIGQPGTTLYLSCLLRKTNNNDEYLAVLLQGGNNVAWVTNQNPRVSVGYFSTSSNNQNIRYWSLGINNNTYRSNVPVVVGETALLVVRIQFGASSNTVSLWVNPTTIGSTEPTPNITQNTNEVLAFNAVAGYLGSSSGQGAMDELRLAASYRCVVPDASTDVNVPPDAYFVANPNTSVSPSVVSFDGSNSTDSDGQIVSYTWNFMDGSPSQTTNSPTVTHSYSDLGEFVVSLTVTDNEGLSHTYYRTITITDTNGSFPCLTTLRHIQRASCGQQNGSFLVIPPTNGTFMLLNQAGNTVPVSSNPNIYQNLAVGNYTLYVQGANACRDTMYVAIEVDSTTCPNWVAPNKLKIGMNLDYHTYYGRERPFKNLFMGASEWRTYNVTSPTPWSVWDTGVQSQIPRDTLGYPTVIPFNTTIGLQGVRSSLSADGHYSSGNYVLLYDGVGVLEMNGVVVNSNQAGRIAFTVIPNYTSNIWLNITQSEQGNHIRNIRILREGDELTYLAQPFYQPFLDKLQNFHAVRFNEWSNTNTGNFLPVSWADRSRPNYFTQSSVGGVSYEYEIMLCNAIQRDAWVHIPHTASDEYIEQMAILFRDKLNPSLKVYVEYSNEVWNWMFAQANYVSQNEPQNISYPRRYANRSANTFRIWSRVFSTQMHRLKRVLNVQYGNTNYGEQVLAHMKPQDYDYLSPSWYFGYGGACAAGFNANTTAAEIIECTRQSFLQNYQNLRQEYLNASLYGKKVVHYEGGQHMSDNGATTPYTQALWDAHIHPNIYTLYSEVLDSLKKLGPDLACAYNLARIRQTVYGAFGHLESIDQTPSMQATPKWMALMDNNRTECLSNMVLNGNLTNILYRAGQKIENLDTTTVQNHTNVELRAGNSIELKAGFRVEPGAVFRTQIAGCNE
ncbi:MAG: PKD domain-containing protein [Spirosomataceae bacterium]